MTEPDPHSPDPARHKAVLAAILAVQRGHLAPEEAVRVLADLPPGTEPMQTLLELAPPDTRNGLRAEADALAENPELAARTLATFGVAADRVSSLARPGSDTAATIKETLLTVTTSRPPADRATGALSRLPKPGDSGRYTVRSEFARGGMGRVLLALDNAVGREVAMKELLPNALDSASLPASARDASRGELVERFLREAKVTGQLEHPNIVPVYEIGAREDGRVFYTMKLVRGKTLAHRLKTIQNDESLDTRGKLAARLKLLDAFHDVCNAVAYAHSRGVIHRDLKPANVMLGEYGETLVLDWGLARVQDQPESTARARKETTPDLSPSLLTDGSDARTLDGAVLGTPAYMPPEQARGDLAQVDQLSDVYALGAMLYEILSGRAPYEGPTAQTVLAKVLVLQPDDLATLAPEAPRELVALANKAMSRDRALRLPGAAQLAAEVAAFRDGRALSVYRYSAAESIARFVRRNRTAVAVSAVALAALAALAVYAFVSIADERDQARDALELATRERQGRERVEAEKAAERAKLVAQRKEQIRDARQSVETMQPQVSRREAGAQLAQIRADPLAVLEPARREKAAAAITRLLEVVRVRDNLLRLLTEPVAGVMENFAANTELDELRAALRDDRMLAAQLATANEDFALAEVILMAAPLGDQARQTELAAVNAARGARLRRHAEQIETALADIRQGLWRSGRPVSAPRLDDYVFRLSSFREPQTVNLLEQALNNYTRKAAAPAAGLWTQTERDEITLICRVLASLELPEVAIPPLVDFLRVIRDDRLTIECAEALCLTGNVAAYTPLVELRARVKPASFVWYRVRGYFPRVPEPDPPPPAETAEQLLDRAVLRREQNLTEAAAADIKAAYTLAPDMPRAITAFGTTFLNTSEAKPHYDRAIALKPDFAPAWRERGLWNFRNGNVEQALADLDQAIALDAADASALSMKGFVLGSTQRHEEALEVTLRATELWPWHAPFWANVGAYALNSRQYDRAVAACSRAIELDPRQQEAWVNRGAAKNALGDHDGALADFTRVLEFSPGYAWGYYNRAHIHRARKDFEAAIYDYTQALERTSANYLRESLLYRARCYRELKRYEPALEDLRAFRQTLTDPERQAAVDAEIAEVEALLKPGE